MISITVATCTNCGRPIPETDQVEDLDATHCERCNRDFYAAMAEQYPNGQCSKCGAEGIAWTCARGVKHQVMGWESGGHHSEGGCGSWRDSAYEPDVDCDVCSAADYAAAAKVDNAKNWLTAQGFDIDNLPF